ncbi:exodeoxyribonuclease V subunit beta [Bacterioplanoides sp.]|uniref:exodeoxyribonuclease V subunit beta n=1 Tax=Bacterioplanoides sp. TaxID=2066072 RepID=UPI003AFFA620
MQALDIRSFPLTGQSLIEASAGTGKTYTITALYNRLLLAHQSPLPRLGCDQILVVTFTRAATEELRGRIRERIRDSFEDCLRLLADSEPQDSEFARLINDLTSPGQTLDLQQLSLWLQANLAQMDEASVFTIHGFCQRMLKQFAFDSGVMFDAELVLDSETYLKQACEDVWRQQSYHLDNEQGRYWLNRYAGPHALLQRFRNWLSRPGMRFIPPPDPSQHFEQNWQQLKQAYLELAAHWQQIGGQGVSDVISQSDVEKRSYSSRYLPNWISSVSAYLAAGFALPVNDKLEKFSSAVLYEKTKKGNPPQHSLFDQVERFVAQADALALQLDIRLFEQVRARYFGLLEKAAALTPDDLLRLLSTALNGEQGQLLAQQIRRCYPVAMIDEFQDTDPQQYEIFNAIYPPPKSDSLQAEQRNDSSAYGLYMIGDPKQAIYGFRGADIFTYMEARRALAAQQRFTLDTNWRSHSRLIAGVNHLWGINASPFVFDQDIEFVPVKAAGKHDQQGFQLAGEALPPLQIWSDTEQSLSRLQAQQQVAEQCAQQIAGLIYGDYANLGEHSVEAKDIAVLVRSRRQAGWIREQLSRQQVGSVFLTRDSVYDSQEARDVLAWLSAVHAPSDERAVRTALATAIQGLDAQALNTLLNDEQAWEQQLEQFYNVQYQWRKRGIMAALMLWLEAPRLSTDLSSDHDSLAVYLRRSADGERRLTNLMHLGELLQTASRRVRGQQGLIRWLGERIFDEERSGEEAQLRLESDANLVTIVTIHKSKGLEYPLVFLPYLWDDSFEPHRLTEAQYYQGYDDHDSDEPGVVLNLAPDNEAKQLAIRDAKAEYLRLLYVALTRAKYGCFTWLVNAVDGRSKKSLLPKSALGYLLNIDQQPDWSKLQQQLTHQDIAFSEFPDWRGDFFQPDNRDNQQTAVVEQSFTTRLYDYWRVSSYSQLTADISHPAKSSADKQSADSAELDWQDPQLEGMDWEAAGDIQRSSTELLAPDNPALLFPKGANPGTCLHAILEHWDFNDPDALLDICQQQLGYYGIELDEQSIKDVAQWLTQVVNTPLLGEFCLAHLASDQRLDEMEFHLPIATELLANRINQLMAAYPITQDPSLIAEKRLNFDPLTGYLKGFIDLIFCHEGRYYVADYKSNHLGDQAADYISENLALSMADHHYDVQAWIYTIALDQLLSQRLADYSPQKHLGGVFYLYLRGMTDEFCQAARLLVSAQQPTIEQDLFAPESADDLEQDSDMLPQHPGVFYQRVDLQKLNQWKSAFGYAND